MNLVFYVSATDSFNMKDHSEIIFARPNSAADMTCSWSRLHKNTFGPFSIFVVLGAMDGVRELFKSKSFYSEN